MKLLLFSILMNVVCGACSFITLYVVSVYLYVTEPIDSYVYFYNLFLCTVLVFTSIFYIVVFVRAIKKYIVSLLDISIW